MGYWTGCAVWAYKGWVGDLYPKGAKQADFLALYTERLTAVEGNTTFYAMPPVATVQKWAEAMPEGFLFCPKVYREITHGDFMTDGFGMAEEFLRRMQHFEGNLGPMMVQLPPRYGPDKFSDLKRFLEWWPRDEFPLTVELRHSGWWRGETHVEVCQMMQGLGVGRVLLDTRPIYECDDDPQVESKRRKPRVPVRPIRTSDNVIVRYIGHPTPENNERYLAAWADEVTAWLSQGVDVYFFAHCPVEERSPGYAKRFQEMLEERGADARALPWDSVPEPADVQMSLF